MTLVIRQQDPWDSVVDRYKQQQQLFGEMLTTRMKIGIEIEAIYIYSANMRNTSSPSLFSLFHITCLHCLYLPDGHDQRHDTKIDATLHFRQLMFAKENVRHADQQHWQVLLSNRLLHLFR